MLFETFRKTATSNPSKIAIMELSRKTTYSELLSFIQELSKELDCKQAVVHSILPNSPGFICAYLASIQSENIFFPIERTLSREEFSHHTQITQANDILITDVTFFNKHQNSLLDFSKIILIDPFQLSIHSSHGKIKVSKARFESSALQGLILTTSGSTHKNKGVLVSQEACYHRVHDLVHSLKLHADDKTLCAVPLSHSHGLECLALPTLLSGGTLLLIDASTASPTLIAQLIDNEKVTFFSSLPIFYQMILDQNIGDSETFNSLRLPFCGSAALQEKTAQGFFENYGTPICQGYGLVEVCVATLNMHHPEPKHFTSTGHPINGTQLSIASDQELYLKSRGFFTGYLDQGELTRPNGLKDGYWPTGDLCSTVDDFYFIEGRKDSMLKIQGHKVYPTEIESILIKIPGIKEAAVYPIQKDGRPELGCWIIASNPLRHKDIENRIFKTLIDHRRPTMVKFCEALPKSPLGKILYSRLS